MADEHLIRKVEQLLTHSSQGDHVLVFKLDASAWTGNSEDVFRHPVEGSRKVKDMPDSTILYARRRVAELMVEFEAKTIRKWLQLKEQADDDE